MKGINRGYLRYKRQVCASESVCITKFIWVVGEEWTESGSENSTHAIKVSTCTSLINQSMAS